MSAPEPSTPSLFADILDALPASREMSGRTLGATFCVYRTPEGRYAIAAGNRAPPGSVVVGVSGPLGRPPPDAVSRANTKAAKDRAQAKRARRASAK